MSNVITYHCSAWHNRTSTYVKCVISHQIVIKIDPIGSYRDVWNAAIASSRKSLTSRTGVMCNTSQ